MLFRFICCEKYETAISNLVEGSETFLSVSYTVEIGSIKWQVYFAINMYQATEQCPNRL